jgi:hypothetical protein
MMSYVALGQLSTERLVQILSTSLSSATSSTLSSKAIVDETDYKDGFGGIKWGTNLSTVKDLQEINTTKSGNIWKYYKRGNGKAKFGKITMGCRYGAWGNEGEFGVVFADCFDDMFIGTLQYFRNKFGSETGRYTDAGMEMYTFLGPDTATGQIKITVSRYDSGCHITIMNHKE